MNFSILWDDRSREVTHLAYGHTVGCWLQSWPGPSELRFAGRGWHPRLFLCVRVRAHWGGAGPAMDRLRGKVTVVMCG